MLFPEIFKRIFLGNGFTVVPNFGSPGFWKGCVPVTTVALFWGLQPSGGFGP